MDTTPIHAIQGRGLHSPLTGQEVRARGVVTGSTRKGFFLQDPEGGPADRSHAIFVYHRRRPPRTGSRVEVHGKVVDFREGEVERPTTQIHASGVRTLAKQGPRLDPVWLTADDVTLPPSELAERLNRLEAMVVGIQAGATFVAPSNPFGDYVVLPEGTPGLRTAAGGILVDPEVPHRWLPSFRIRDYKQAPRVDVGAILDSDVVGPLNYRVGSYQIAATGPLRIREARIPTERTSLRSGPEHVTILTLNGFNLDPHVEDPSRVDDPRRDIDDDVGDQRYRKLAEAIVRDAGTPDLVALQEIQDDDGAEITGEVGAERNYRTLVQAIAAAGGPPYEWIDRPPRAGADGGQPGGNIRNGYLYRPDRIGVDDTSPRRLGEDDPAFEDSRKPLLVRFRFLPTARTLVVVNVHLASKRHQHSGFAAEEPGLDPRLPLRVRQAGHIRAALAQLPTDEVAYVTGDFNDHEFSPTLQALLGDDHTNLLETLPPEERYDYNHRGWSQALMHGVLARRHVDACAPEYAILHGNELTGVPPGRMGTKATDHAYVLTRLRLSGEAN